MLLGQEIMYAVGTYTGVGTLPAIPVPAQAGRPRSALQKVSKISLYFPLHLSHFFLSLSLQTLDDSLNPEVVPAVETWFTSATNEGSYV